MPSICGKSPQLQQIKKEYLTRISDTRSQIRERDLRNEVAIIGRATIKEFAAISQQTLASLYDDSLMDISGDLAAICALHE